MIRTNQGAQSDKQHQAEQTYQKRARALKDKIQGLVRRVRNDMRQIKTLIKKEKKREHSCLEKTAVDDCSDLKVLTDNLREDEDSLLAKLKKSFHSS